MTKEKWFTIVEMVNEETGEILTKNDIYKHNLKLVTNEIKYEKNAHNQNIRKICKIYRTNEQQRLEF